MSDLLPLVAAALRDKVAADAGEELSALRKERDAFSQVEVLRSSRNNGDDEGEDEAVVVYASAGFEEGCYGGNTNLWEVKLLSGKSDQGTCKLADLRNCHVCVGGGLPVASLDDSFPNNPPYESWLFDPTNSTCRDEYKGRPCEDSVGVRICFCPFTVWLIVWVRGWPREEWEAKIQADDLDAGTCLSFLIDTVALQYPDATAEFKEVSFVAKHVHGALKRLLPPQRKSEVEAERDARNQEENPEFNELFEFVIRSMRAHGNTAGPELFMPQAFQVMHWLSALGINERGDNDEVIESIVSFYEREGAEGLEAMVAHLRRTLS